MPADWIWQVLNVTGSVASLYGAINRAVREQHDCSLDELFVRSFKSVVDVKRYALARHTEDRNSESVQVDDENLRGAITTAGDLITQLRADTAEGRIAEIAPAFRHAIILPGFPGTDKELDEIVADLLGGTLVELWQRLPHHDQAYREAVLEGQASHLQHAERTEEHASEVNKALEEIREAVRRLEEKGAPPPDLLLAEASAEHRKNPFRLVRAEEFNHNYKKLAQTYHELDAQDLIVGRRPVLLIGGRGSGKSMILRCLSAAAEMERARIGMGDAAAKYQATGADYFGVYAKLAKGFFPAPRPEAGLDLDAVRTLFEHYLNMSLTEALVTTLERCAQEGMLDMSSSEEKSTCETIGQLIEPETAPSTFTALREMLQRQKARVGDYVGRMTIPTPAAPEYDGAFTYVHDYLERVCDILTRAVRELNDSRIYFLLDEFENLLDYQQQAVFTVMKLSPLSLTIKSAVRTDLGIKTNVDLQGQPLQDRDAPAVRLDYDPPSASYRTLLWEIARKRLQSENYAQEDITQLLEPFGLTDDFSTDVLENELAAHLAERGDSIEGLSPKRLQELHHNLDVGLTFRILDRQHRSKEKAYGGFETFAMLSSGIISNFMELCKMAIYFAEQDGVNVAGGAQISVLYQSRAAHTVSGALLQRIAGDIPTHGDTLRQFVIDLGDIFRSRLLHHPSEPEGARLTIRDPQNIPRKENRYVEEILGVATEWSLLQELSPTDTYRPRHRSSGRSSEYILNRIYAPALQISYRPRWRCEVDVSQLTALLDPDRRVSAIGTLKEQQPERPPTLFDDIRRGDEE